MQIDLERLKRMTSQYSAEYEAYQLYSSFLRNVLVATGRRYAPGSFVEARAKTLASLAEKIVRKQAKFESDPHYDLTDRCGARVVVQSTADVATICSFIEKNFLIDRPNSLDHAAHLKTNEFGYRSIHYIVQVEADCLQIGGIPVPPEVRRGKDGFKAEIQVRTLAEHVLASGLHDRLYKTPIVVPEPLKRENARLAATLESVDGRYAALSSGIDAYLGFFSAYLDNQGIARELAILRAARDCDPSPASKLELGLKLAALAGATGDWEGARLELETSAKLAESPPAKLRVELAHVLCRTVHCNEGAPEFRRAKEMLAEVADAKVPETEPETAEAKALRAQAAYRLGWCLGFERFHERDAAARFRQAWELERDNPYFLTAYLEFEIATQRSRGFVQMMDSVLRSAIAACHRHVEVGIEIPRAHFTTARLHLLLAEGSECLTAYAAGIARVLEPGTSIAAQCLTDELEFLRRINAGHPTPPEHMLTETVCKALTVALAIKAPTAVNPPVSDAVRHDRIARIAARARKNVLTVAGGAKGIEPDKLENYRTILQRAMQEVSGIVVYGGTTVGIPGLAGNVATSIGAKGIRKFLLIGYRAQKFVPGTKSDEANADIIVVSDNEKSSANEPLTGWLELVQAGISPKNVQVLCINGGAIAAFEIRFGLAVGARVAVVEKSGRAADEILKDPIWKNHRNLIPLPEDGIDDATMRAFARNSQLEIAQTELDDLAKAVHANYLKLNPYADSDFSPERRPWADLREDLRESNRQQVLYAAEILASEDYRLVKPAAGVAPAPPAKFTDEQVDRMAEKEHGRWCLERLAAGWVRGKIEKKDVVNKINPAIKPYSQLAEEVKRYDREAIMNYAAVFALGGYDIVHTDGAQT